MRSVRQSRLRNADLEYQEKVPGTVEEVQPPVQDDRCHHELQCVADQFEGRKSESFRGFDAVAHYWSINSRGLSMKMRALLVFWLLTATAASAQVQPMLPRNVTVPAASPAPSEETGMEVAERATTPRVDFSVEDRREMDEARDIRRLKSDMALLRQELHEQRADIEQLRACLKLHDRQFSSKVQPARAAAMTGSALAGPPPASASQFSMAEAGKQGCKAI